MIIVHYLISITLYCLEMSISTAAGRVAILLHGETFRINSAQFSREIGIKGIPDQLRASKSHIQYLISPMEFMFGYSSVEVYMESYNNSFSGFDSNIIYH